MSSSGSIPSTLISTSLTSGSTHLFTSFLMGWSQIFITRGIYFPDLQWLAHTAVTPCSVGRNLIDHHTFRPDFHNRITLTCITIETFSRCRLLGEIYSFHLKYFSTPTCLSFLYIYTRELRVHYTRCSRNAALALQVRKFFR